jgi:hypothetical protein
MHDWGFTAPSRELRDCGWITPTWDFPDLHKSVGTFWHSSNPVIATFICGRRGRRMETGLWSVTSRVGRS